MKYDIIVIGGGASGLMAAYKAAEVLRAHDMSKSVTVLEKMPRPGRKIMITGKGRCNFTNVKPWDDFSRHVKSNASFLKSAFHGFTPADAVAFFKSFGMESIIERGDRAFPISCHSSDVVDTLVRACYSKGVKIETEAEVASMDVGTDGGFRITTADGRTYLCRKLVIATGGLSYPGTGSTGDGYGWAEAAGHHIRPTFPSLTALVPRDYKETASKGHIPRETPLNRTGEELCGIQLRNISVQLLIDGNTAGSEFGDLDFTDGGMEGPIGFQISRKAVKAMINGSKVRVTLDLKPGVNLTELTVRVKELWEVIGNDPRSQSLREKERCRVLLGKLMPRELIPAFSSLHPEIITLERRGRKDTKVWVNLVSIAKALKSWEFEIQGYVGYERAVVTAGGVDTDEILSKTMESRLVPGLYFCGEVLDVDCDTGGYNLQSAFSTGALAGSSAAKSIMP